MKDTPGLLQVKGPYVKGKGKGKGKKGKSFSRMPAQLLGCNSLVIRSILNAALEKWIVDGAQKDCMYVVLRSVEDITRLSNVKRSRRLNEQCPANMFRLVHS